MNDIFLDESGYTGRQLLDARQPHFVLASSRIGDEAAEKILRYAFPRYQAAEFKFENIWGRPRSQRRLPEFAEAVGDVAEKVYIWHLDKRFCLLIKMIEFLMEPTIYDAGYDFYAGGYGSQLANYVHFGLTQIAADGVYDQTLQAYYRFARHPTPDNRLRLSADLAALSLVAPSELTFFYDASRRGLHVFDRHHRAETFEDTLELYVTSVLNVVGYWAQRGVRDMRILHDESAGFMKQRDLWSAMTSPDVPPQRQPVLNGPDIEFPLPVRATEPLRSHDSPAVQLCDLVAGLAAKVFAKAAQDEPALMQAISQTGFAQIDTNGVAAGTSFPKRAPRRRSGPDPVDRMVGIVRSGRPSKRPPPHPQARR